MRWSRWIGRRIFVVLTNGLKYSGLVEEADEEYISIIDIYNSPVRFKTSEISIIQEKRGEK